INFYSQGAKPLRNCSSSRFTFSFESCNGKTSISSRLPRRPAGQRMALLTEPIICSQKRLSWDRRQQKTPVKVRLHLPRCCL
ncbi:hypothetical protein CIB84_008618, partial [Bambusicola thoracicus]